MKLRSKIERGHMSNGTRTIRYTFPADVRVLHVSESITKRNIGPRPWGEAFYSKENGERVVMYFGTQGKNQ